MLPARSLRIIAPTGGEQMQMRMVLAIAPMGVGHHNVASPEGLAPDLTIEIIQTLHPAAHQRAQHDRSIVIEGGAEHGRGRQDDVAINHPLVEHGTHLADPVVHSDFGAPQAQRRLTAHRHQVLALAAMLVAVFDIPHLFRIATRQHLGHQIIIVGCLIARMGVGESVPVVGKDLLEDVPVPRGCCHHRVAPSGGDRIVTVQRL